MEQTIKELVGRPIKEDELEMIMKWRMLPEITRYMYTDPQLTIKAQSEWYRANQEDDLTQIFMIEVNQVPIGVLNIYNIDRKNLKCEWGYYIAVKEMRSLELALALEWNVYDYVFEELRLSKLQGEVFSFNKAVIRIHKMCGSEVEDELKGHIYKNGELLDVTRFIINKEKWHTIKGKYKYKRMEFQL